MFPGVDVPSKLIKERLVKTFISVAKEQEKNIMTVEN
jgi:hypothetical protein